MSTTLSMFEQIKAEYDAALEAAQAAQERLKAAGAAYMAAQCGEKIGEDRSDRPGYHKVWYCIRESGHAGAHGNPARPAE